MWSYLPPIVMECLRQTNDRSTHMFLSRSCYWLWVIYSPIGVIYSVQPWNFPVYQPVWVLAANLIAGDLPPVIPQSLRESLGLIVVGFGCGKRAGRGAIK